MKKSIKILYIALAVIVALSPVLLATTINGVTVSPNTSGNEAGTVTGWGNTVVGIIKVVGIFIAVGALMAIGIKYMMGSAEEKAEYKKVMIPYLIGALLLFGAALFADKLAGFAATIFQ